MRIRQDAFDRIVAHATEEKPNECCGLLIGTAELVQDVVRARNAHRSPTRFQVEPADQFAAIRKARAAGLEVVGAYHSHPNGPSGPSELDRVRRDVAAFLTGPSETGAAPVVKTPAANGSASVKPRSGRIARDDL